MTTLDFDFMFRETPLNRTKLDRRARSLRAVVFRPYYPASKLYRVVNDESGLQIDFMPVLRGIRSFASLRSRASAPRLGSADLLVASLEDVIKSKAAAARRVPADAYGSPATARLTRYRPLRAVMYSVFPSAPPNVQLAGCSATLMVPSFVPSAL